MSAMTRAVVLGRQDVAAVRPGPLAFVRRHPIAVFLVLVFGLTWALQIPWIASEQGWLPFEFPLPLLFVMGWMPGLGAILVTAATGGRAGIRALLGRVLIWRLGLHWYLVPILGSAALWTGALALDPLVGGTGLTLPKLSIDLLIGVLVSLVLIFLINSEEIAWRGFAMPRLQARHSALAASLFLGVFEGLFHLPYFFRAGSDQAAAGLPAFMISALAGAVVFTWLFNNTRGSLLAVMLFHTFQNMWIEVFPAPLADKAVAQWAFTALLALAAVILVAVFGPARLSRKPAGELPVVIDAQPFVIASTWLGLLLPTVVITRLVDGPAGLHALFRRVVKVRAALGWYVLAVLAVPLLAVALATIVNGPPTMTLSMLSSAVASGLVLEAVVGGLTVNLWEEMAWMGLAIVLSGAVGLSASFVLFVHMIGRRGPTAALLATYVMPVVAAVLGVLVLGETITPPMLAGSALVLVGVVIFTQG